MGGGQGLSSAKLAEGSYPTLLFAQEPHLSLFLWGGRGEGGEGGEGGVVLKQIVESHKNTRAPLPAQWDLRGFSELSPLVRC